MNWLGRIIQGYVDIQDTILDVGCGINTPLDGIGCRSYLGVDVWNRYLDHIKTKYNTVKIDAINDLGFFMDKSYDVVVSLDMVEHLPKDMADNVILHLKRIARKYVIIFTPSQFDTNEKAVPDAWNLGECPYQKHQSLFTRQEFEYNQFSLIPNPDNGLLAVWKSP